jgi:hypothetical protein
VALLAKAGTFNAPGSGGTQVTGLGFRPGAIILWTENATAENTFSNGLDVAYGFWVRPRPTLAPRAQSAWVSSNHAAGSANAAAGLNATRPISNRGWTVSGIVERSDNDGFTVSYASGPPANTRIHYLALNTDALAQIMTVNIPAGAAVGSRIAVRGVGFAPTGVMAIAQSLASQTVKTLGFGVADKAGNQWAMSGASLHNADPMNTSRRWREDAIIALVNNAGATMGRLRVAGYHADGVDLEVVEPPTAATTTYLLCLGNVNTWAGAAAKPTGAAPQVQTFTTGFAPKGMVFAGTHQTVVGMVANHRGFMGGMGGAVLAQAAGAWSDTDALATSSTRGVARTDRAAIKVDTDTATQEANAVGALTTTGGTLTWNPNDAVAVRLGAYAIGTLKHPLGGAVSEQTDATTGTFIQPAIVGGNVTENNEVTGAIRPTNILGGDVTEATDPAAFLAVKHTVGGVVTEATDPTSYLALQHTLGGDVTEAAEAETLNLWITTPLGGDVTEANEVLSSLALKHTLGGYVTEETSAEAYFSFPLPTVRQQISGRELSGTINLHPNPGAEDGLWGWFATGGASVAEEVTTVWEGARAVKVTLPGVAPDEGVYIQSVAGADLTDVVRSIYGSLFTSGDAIPLKSFSRVRYTDGTTVDGEVSTGLVATLAPDWQRFIAVPIATDPAKKVFVVETYFVTESATAGEFVVDGAQVEEDRGDGPTQWASGAYGEETGRWSGTPHRSLTVRQPITILREAVGYGGHYEVTASLWKMTWDNQRVEDISRYVTGGGVSGDSGRDITWTLDCTMTREGWKTIRPNFDWVAPFMTVRYADGTSTTGQLGLFFVVPSEQDREEHRGTVRLNAFDPLWFVARQGLTGNLVAQPGVNKARTARQVLDGAVLTGGREDGIPENHPFARRRYYIPDTNDEWKRKKEWPKDQNRLIIANAIVRSGGMLRIHTNGTGFMTTRKRGEARWKNREPVRMWAAHVPDGFDQPDYMRGNIRDLPHEVIGRIPTVPKAVDMFDEILLVNDDPDRGRIYVKGKVKGKHGRHPRVVGQNEGRHRVKSITIPFLDDQATAELVARAIADDMSASTEHSTITVVPDPRVDYIHETVATAIWDAHGEEVLVGHWRVGRIAYRMWPNSPTMTLELSRIHHGSDDVDIEVEVA